MRGRAACNGHLGGTTQWLIRLGLDGWLGSSPLGSYDPRHPLQRAPDCRECPSLKAPSGPCWAPGVGGSGSVDDPTGVGDAPPVFKIRPPSFCVWMGVSQRRLTGADVAAIRTIIRQLGGKS